MEEREREREHRRVTFSLSNLTERLGKTERSPREDRSEAARRFRVAAEIARWKERCRTRADRRRRRLEFDARLRARGCAPELRFDGAVCQEPPRLLGLASSARVERARRADGHGREKERDGERASNKGTRRVNTARGEKRDTAGKDAERESGGWRSG